MRYGSRGVVRHVPGEHGLIAGAQHGVAPPAAGREAPNVHGAGEMSAATGQAEVQRPHPTQQQGVAAGEMAREPKPFNFKRLQWSCTLVGVFGCLLLAAPIYLLYGRVAACLGQPGAQAALASGPLGQSLRFVEIIMGLLGALVIPMLGRERRGRIMTWLGLAVLAMLLLLLQQAAPLFEIFVGYSSVALLSLISLDAVANVRPAVRRSARFARLQLVAAAAVTVLWFLPAVVTLTNRQIDAVVSVPLSAWGHLALRIGTMSGELTGLVAMAGAFVPYHRGLQLICRGLGTLSLTLIMGLALYAVIERGHALGRAINWQDIEYLWLFLTVAGALTLIWAGLMQRLMISAADILQAGGEE